MIDGHKLELSVLVNVLPRVWVVVTIPDDFRATSQAGEVPSRHAYSAAGDDVDGNDFRFVPDLEELGSGRHDGWMK